MAGNTNVSSLIPSSINNTLSQVSNPKAFGDQIINDKVQKIKNSPLNKINELKSQIQDLTQKIIDLEVTHANNLNDLLLKTTPTPPTQPVLTIEEYQKAVINENNSYTEEKTLLQQEKLSLQQKLQDILNDPYKKIKEATQKRIKRTKQKRQRNKNKENKEKKRLVSKVLKSTAKSLASIIALQGTKLLFSIVSNNKKLQDLVDDTNTIIDNATTKKDIENAKVIRNSTLSILNDNEIKLLSLQKLISNLNRIITVLNITLRVIILLFTIPKPFGLGPTMPTPVANRVKKLQDLVFALNIILSILQGILDAKLDDLRDLKTQLKNINDILDSALLNNLSDTDIQAYLDSLKNQPTNFPEYKGFKFAIKEEETLGTQQAVVVRGNIKRKYAVAINKDGVEVLKSEFSFTLDPPDLVEQLKIIIDQQNLQG
jgi:hypothetical protein